MASFVKESIMDSVPTMEKFIPINTWSMELIFSPLKDFIIVLEPNSLKLDGSILLIAFSNFKSPKMVKCSSETTYSTLIEQ